MAKLKLVLAVHNHQPVGNFDHVFVEAHDRCYRPFLDVLGEFPAVRVALHYSGPLLEWFQANRPSFLVDLRALATRGQVEMLGGGFYEPMLAVLPDHDARGQIELMQTFCQRHLNQQPRGMWLAERVWDPDLPRVIAPTGMRFTLLDDSHFFAAGVPSGRLGGHYLTDKAGETLAIFPIDKGLRYAIPFRPVPELTQDWERLNAERGEDPSCLTYGDDGEKFGLWPDTHDWVYGKGWLRDFFRLLTDRQDLVETVHPTQELVTSAPSGRAYLPSCSYEEMGEWSMPAQSIHRYAELKARLNAEGVYARYAAFIRGGIWQGFFAKYPESNHMHKRALAIGRRFWEVEPRAEGLKELWEARTELYRSQCNCAYWHGLFGGIYLNNLRHALTEAMLKAESQLDRLEGTAEGTLQIAVHDFDTDLHDEVAVRNRAFSVIVHPALGGALSEIAFRPANYQLADVMARREEGYHERLRRLEQERKDRQPQGSEYGGVASIHDLVRSKEDDLSRFVAYDDYRRLCFIDRCYEESFTLDKLESGQDGDVGDLGRIRYRTNTRPGKQAAKDFTLVLSGEGHVLGRPLSVEKRYAFSAEASGFSVGYLLCNTGGEALSFVFAPELSLNLLAGNAPDRYYLFPDGARLPMAHRGHTDRLDGLRLVEGWARFTLSLKSDPTFQLWCYPVETVSNSEGGFERNFQGSCLLLRVPLVLGPGESRQVRFEIGLEKT
jgi:alpha-amylase/alpha-mannosidase (GH57 family)